MEAIVKDKEKPQFDAKNLFGKKVVFSSCPSPDITIKTCVTGSLAQLVERFVYTEDVGSSSLSRPTIIHRFDLAAIPRVIWNDSWF